jgi:hydroxymethylpyrimidine pyrophosphatase-like HAD family hydrolase
MAGKRKISLVLADVDGTLVTEDKILTKRACEAVNALQDAGIRFAITSGRPPLGMAMLFDALDIETPIAGFNGGLFVERDLTILDEKTVPADVARQAIDLMRTHGLDTWVYSGNDWLITKAVAPHVAREAWTVKFQPKVVADVREHLQQVAKIVGVSDDSTRCGAVRPTRRLRSDSVRPPPGRNPTISTSPTSMRTKAPWWNISRSISAYRRRRLRRSAISQTTC